MCVGVGRFFGGDHDEMRWEKKIRGTGTGRGDGDGGLAEALSLSLSLFCCLFSFFPPFFFFLSLPSVLQTSRFPLKAAPAATATMNFAGWQAAHTPVSHSIDYLMRWPNQRAPAKRLRCTPIQRPTNNLLLSTRTYTAVHIMLPPSALPAVSLESQSFYGWQHLGQVPE